VGRRRVQPRAPEAPPRPLRDGPRPLLDGRLVNSPERSADHGDLLARLDRARPQREPGQRRGAAQGARGPGGDLPVDSPTRR
jgi:hypothetical protein